MEKKTARVLIKDKNPDNFQVEISGYLDLHTTGELWDSCMLLQKEHKPKKFILDATKLSYCDGAGIGLILELQDRQDKTNNQFEIIGLNKNLQNLITTIKKESHKPHIFYQPHMPIVANIGQFVTKFWRNILENITFIGMLFYQLIRTLVQPKTMRWHDFWKAIMDVGPNAFLLIALIGFLVGLISSFQAAIPLERFGAQIYIINLVGIGLLREMGPLMSAVLLAGRTASSFAAELGTMKINQEIDALNTMGLDSVRFLVIPRVLATSIMTPFLNVFLILFGLIGCGIVMKSLGYNFHVYLDQLKHAAHIRDFVGGMIKTFVFGVVIGSTGCLHGLKTKLNASAVGYSTTQAVVSSIIMIIFIDGIFAFIYYVLGV